MGIHKKMGTSRAVGAAGSAESIFHLELFFIKAGQGSSCLSEERTHMKAICWEYLLNKCSGAVDRVTCLF